MLQYNRFKDARTHSVRETRSSFRSSGASLDRIFSRIRPISSISARMVRCSSADKCAFIAFVLEVSSLEFMQTGFLSRAEGRGDRKKHGAANEAQLLSNEVLTHGIEHDFSGVVEVQLLHQIRAMALNRIKANVENSGYFLVRFSFRQKLQHLSFASG